MNRAHHLSIFFFVVLFALSAGLYGCGKKNDPKPPEDDAPSPVKNVVVKGAVDAVELYWDAPDTTEAGDELKELGGFFVRRSEYVKGERPDFEDIGDVPPNPDPLVTAYSFRDTNVSPGKVYDYVIVPKNIEEVEGLFDQSLRVTFLGESTSVESVDNPIKRTERTRVEKE